MSCPVYEDFYQKALIPIGVNDQSLLNKFNLSSIKFPEFATHWLIALEGEVIPKQNKYYHWKVSIYPSNLHGSFVWDQAFYSSPYVLSIDEALELSRKFETCSKNDELLSKHILEKIS